jgi:hypothetical protein
MKQSEQLSFLLLSLQVVVTAYLWVLNALSSVSASRYALFLAVDLLSFAMVAYLYRKQRWNEFFSRAWIFASAIGLVILILSSLFFP